MFLKFRNILALVLVLFAFSTCVEQSRSASVYNNGRFQVPIRDLETIQTEGKLRVVVDYNFTNYFVYRGKPMGFKYEMLRKLAQDLNVKLEFTVSNDMEETIAGLESGRFDLAAKNLTVTSEREIRVDFTRPIFQTRQVLVQRNQLAFSKGKDKFVMDVYGLDGKSLVLQKNTVFVGHLRRIEMETGIQVGQIEESTAGMEQLVSMVSSGEIDFTVCDEYVAKLYAKRFTNLDISVVLSDPQDIAWAVRENASHFRDYLNHWLEEYTASDAFSLLQNRYYHSTRSVNRVRSDYHSLARGRISPYDEIIKREAAAKNWDWRLISAIAFQESQFDPAATSWAGASGLMQLMPETANAFGVTNINDPEENIRAGIRLLSWLDSQLKGDIQDENERLKFVLASYNVGLGHVKDAQRLAGKYGKDPFRWKNNVDEYLLKKSQTSFYTDPVVKWGYARGIEPYEFVNIVLNNYGHYKNVIPE
jgi:membrane-bound lytic murein transglycosylase F